MRTILAVAAIAALTFFPLRAHPQQVASGAATPTKAAPDSGAAGAVANPTVIASELEQRYQALLDGDPERDVPASARLATISEHYARLFPYIASPRFLRDATAADLGFAFRAASLAWGYIEDERYLADLRAVFGELADRGIASTSQKVDFLGALVRARHFDAARAFARELRKQHPDLDIEPIPEISGEVDAAEPWVYAVADDAKHLERVPLPVSKGMHLLVVAHPLCGFSRQAMTDLAADDELGPVVRRLATWLSPVDGRLYLPEVADWNRSHPQTPVVLTHRRNQWPMIDDWSTPTFYLLRDGELVGKVQSWPLDTGNRAALAGLLRAGGVIPED